MRAATSSVADVKSPFLRSSTSYLSAGTRFLAAQRVLCDDGSKGGLKTGLLGLALALAPAASDGDSADGDACEWIQSQKSIRGAYQARRTTSTRLPRCAVLRTHRCFVNPSLLIVPSYTRLAAGYPSIVSHHSTASPLFGARSIGGQSIGGCSIASRSIGGRSMASRCSGAPNFGGLTATLAFGDVIGERALLAGLGAVKAQDSSGGTMPGELLPYWCAI